MGYGTLPVTSAAASGGLAGTALNSVWIGLAVACFTAIAFGATRLIPKKTF